MNQYIAFLRGINLGKRRIKMPELQRRFKQLKFANVSTLIASGNVIFESRRADATKVEEQIEQHLARELGYEVDTFVRTRRAVMAIATAEPFSEADMASDANTINVGLFKTPLPADVARKLEAVRTEVDQFRVIGKEYFWLCRIKMSDSHVWDLPSVKALKFPTSSMRNLKTLRKLAEQFPAVD